MQKRNLFIASAMVAALVLPSSPMARPAPPRETVSRAGQA